MVQSMTGVDGAGQHHELSDHVSELTISRRVTCVQLSAQRAALEAAKKKGQYREAVESFLEELVVRRELADNFCEYEPLYDDLGGAAAWARETLTVHTQDKREFLYTRCAWTCLLGGQQCSGLHLHVACARLEHSSSSVEVSVRITIVVQLPAVHHCRERSASMVRSAATHKPAVAAGTLLRSRAQHVRAPPSSARGAAPVV
jgi:hypothetical protein